MGVVVTAHGVTSGASPAHEAYAFNLDQVSTVIPATHYTNYPFSQILRFGDNYFGVAADGLYQIGGDLDELAAIAWEWRTARDYFGSKQFKRVVSAYVSGRLELGADMTEQLEAQDFTYRHTSTRATPMMHRIHVGKGTREHYYAFGLGDAGGGYSEIDFIDIETQELRRAI